LTNVSLLSAFCTAQRLAQPRGSTRMLSPARQVRHRGSLSYSGEAFESGAVGSTSPPGLCRTTRWTIPTRDFPDGLRPDSRRGKPSAGHKWARVSVSFARTMGPGQCTGGRWQRFAICSSPTTSIPARSADPSFTSFYPAPSVTLARAIRRSNRSMHRVVGALLRPYPLGPPTVRIRPTANFDQRLPALK
jgi:hypothetical protein